MKKSVLLFCLILILGAGTFAPQFLQAQGADNPALKILLNNYAARNFTGGDLTKTELDTVIQAGLRAPSARNGQPWHFTVVQNQALGKQIISNLTDGNIIIVVSAEGDGKTNGSEILDCGLAVQSIYLAAQALGLGSRIYTGPVDSINKNLKTQLGFPRNHNAIAVIRIGRLQGGADAASSASPRNAAERVVTYK